MNTHRLALAIVSLLIGDLTLAAETRTPEDVVRDYAATWNAGDEAGFFALQDPDIHKYSRETPNSEFKLTTSGLDEVKRKYRPLFAKTSRVEVHIVSLTTLGEMVVTRDHVTNPDEHYESNEMTMYQVHDGRIVNMWYLGREVVSAH